MRKKYFDVLIVAGERREPSGVVYSGAVREGQRRELKQSKAVWRGMNEGRMKRVSN